MMTRPLPPILQQQGQQTAAALPVPADDSAIPALAMSDFISDALISHPAWLQELTAQPPRPGEGRDYVGLLASQLAAVDDETTLMRELRLFRHYTLVRIGWAQILGLCDTGETLTQLSQLAETLIIATRDWLWHACCRKWGTPCGTDGTPQPLMILGMGKLGGGELNFSSDIDLIFAYPENGFTRGGGGELDNAQFFTRLGQRVIKALDQPTVDGFVYRVDMRLRPFGDSGPLVLSFAALEDYYQEQGRDWERYAMIKARLMGGHGDPYSQELRSMLRPFIYRRYIDFSVIQSLRNMKQMIAREVRRRGLKDNIKLGACGIREIEFIAQVFQLIRGGREPRLQARTLLPTLATIGELGLLAPAQSARLGEAYLYLRRLENLLQGINDQQTQTLPADSLNQARLAWGMDEADWPQLTRTLAAHMQAVRVVFDELIGDDAPDAENNDTPGAAAALWQEPMSQASEADVAGVPCPRLAQHVADFRRDVVKRTLGPRGREVLDALMPRLLAHIGDGDAADVAFERLAPVLLSIVSRTTYLELLLEYPGALGHLIRLCAASPMIASQLARHPLLLDELLDPATLYHPPAPSAYGDELRQYLLRVPEEDEEQQLEALRQFKQAQQLRIAAAGMLVSTLSAFEDYQLNEAWTWEHQALVRARMVYGTSALQEGFNAIRRRVLCRGRDPATLRREVSEMRAKMRQHLASKQSDVFDIKTDEGGITDIEFLAQYLVLRHAAEKPELTRWSDNVRIFELMAQHGIIDGDDADGLRASYTTLRDTLHHLALPGRVPVAQFSRERALIGRCWRQWLD